MNAVSGARLRTPEEIALRAGVDFARLLPPQRGQVFADRALRLRQLAAGHSMRDYLLLMAVVCEAQHERLASFPAVPLPTQEQADAAALSGQPLLLTASWPRDAAWRQLLHGQTRGYPGALRPDQGSGRDEGREPGRTQNAAHALPG